jgi:endonuclease YncB( thermonuclease family)
MKRVLIPFILLGLAACVVSQPNLPPPETAAALTLDAMPSRNDTPLPPQSAESTPDTPSYTPTSNTEFDPNSPGVYCIPTQTERIRALVSRVIDGETIEVSIDNTPYNVRYIGLQAPGIAPDIEWQGPQAIAANSDLVSGKFVILIKDVSNADPAGNLLRYVIVDDLFVNYEIIRTGNARAFLVAPDVACGSAFLGAESEAQAALLGIWSPTPIPTNTVTNTPTWTPVPTFTSVPATTERPPCDCNRAYTCNNFRFQADAQACYDYCDNFVGLVDKNGNGKVCESLP